MKPALYFAIRRDLCNSIVAVTTVKGDHWYGRDCRYGIATHGSSSCRIGGLMGKFVTQEQAEAMKEQLGKIRKAYKIRQDEISKQLSALYREEVNAIEAAINEKVNEDGKS